MTKLKFEKFEHLNIIQGAKFDIRYTSLYRNEIEMTSLQHEPLTSVKHNLTSLFVYLHYAINHQLHNHHNAFHTDNKQKIINLQMIL